MSAKKATKRDEPVKLEAALVDLPLLDRLELDALILGVFTEDRPLQGVAGLCDWRLNGRLSALVQDGDFSGQAGETLLTDTNFRLAPVRVLLFGLGPRSELETSSARQAIRNMLVVAKKARFERIGLEPPGLAQGLLPAADLVQTTLDVAQKAYPKAKLTLLCPDKDALTAVAKLAAKDDRISLIDSP